MIGCPVCKGTGKYKDEECRECDGTGLVGDNIQL